MLSGQLPLLHDGTSQWETTRTHLSQASARYLHSCLAFNTSEAASDLNTNSLVSRIDDHLEFLDNQLANQIKWSRQALVRKRNRLAAPFYSIPHEILSEIFTLVVYDRTDWVIKSMEEDVNRFYRRVYALLGICSVWRDIGLSHSALWTLIPVMTRRPSWSRRQFQAPSVYAGRGGGAPLHLAANFEVSPDSTLVSYLDENFHRFHSINMAFDRPFSEICQLFDCQRPSSTLRELSLYKTVAPDMGYPERQSEFGHFRIEKFMRSLHALHIKHVYLNWPAAVLQNLVELAVEFVEFRRESDYRLFLLAISTAPQLQKLQLVSVYVLEIPADTPVSAPISVVLPCLQRLYVGDMYLEDMLTLFRAITPNSYDVSLYLAVSATRPRGLENEVEFPDLFEALQGMRVDTLMLCNDDNDDLQECMDLEDLVQVLPFVTTLKMKSWRFDEFDWEVLTRPVPMPGGAAHPCLRNVQLTSARLVPGERAFIENFLDSHPIENLSLGGYVYNEDDCTLVPIDTQDDTVQLFKSKVPNFHLLPSGYTPPEFRNDAWRL